MTASKVPAALRLPKTVLELIGDLEKAGFEAWAVGGAVRDALLGHIHLDWDLATSATPDQVRTVFGRKRTIPVGVEFGTVGVLDETGVMHEVTTFRRDVRTDGRHAEVEFGASLREDLARRDFTINAIAFSPSRGELSDPFGGRDDLAARRIRAVGDPEARMREDRLRALRALRFAARLGFEIDPSTWDAIRASAPFLTRLSAERVRQEVEKTMDQVAQPSRAFSLWRESGALQVLVPELRGLTDEALSALDCTALPGLSKKPGRRLTRVAVLFSDMPAVDALGVATRLRFSKAEAQWVAAITDRWRTLGAAMSSEVHEERYDRPTLRRWIATVGRLHLGAYFRVASARWAARRSRGPTGSSPSARAVHSVYRRSLKAALTEPVDLRDLAIDGDDLRQAGITPGPGLGKILSSLLDLVLDDPSRNTREQLVDEARRLHSRPE